MSLTRITFRRSSAKSLGDPSLLLGTWSGCSTSELSSWSMTSFSFGVPLKLQLGSLFSGR